MKVINFICSIGRGGMEQAFMDYTETLLSKQHQVIAVIKHNMQPIYQQQLLQLGVKTYHIYNYFGYWDYPAILYLRHILHQEKPDIVLTHNGRSMSLGRRAAKQLAPVVAINHSYNVKRSLNCDLILTVNNAIKAKILTLRPQLKANTHVIGNMLPEVIRKYPVPEETDLSQGLKIGFIGRLHPNKRVNLIIQAVARLQHIPYKLYIAGTGSEQEKLQQLVQQLQLQDKVEFLGWIDDSSTLFTKTNVFCSSASSETFGLTTLEAMYFRQAIILTDTDGSREIINSGKSGLLIANHCETEIIQDLTNTLTWLYQHQPEAKELANNAKLSVTKYTREHVGGRILQLFNKTIDQYRC